MKIESHYRHIKEIARSDFGIFWNTDQEIFIPSIEKVIQYPVSAGEYIGDARSLDGELLIYIKTNYNSGHKVIDSKGNEILSCNSTLLKRKDGINYESEAIANIKIYEEDGLNKNLILSIDYSQIHFVDDQYFVSIPFGDSRKMTLWSIETWQPLWTIETEPEIIDLPESLDGRKSYYFISTILGRIQNVLFVRFHSYKIIGFDISSGEQVSVIHFPDQYPDSFKILDPYKNHVNLNFQVDLENQMLFGLNANWYFEYDLKAKANGYVLWDIRDELNRNGINAVYGQLKWPTDKDHVFFADIGHGRFLNNMGVFDRKTRQVLLGIQTFIDYYDHADTLMVKHPPIRNMEYENGYIFMHYNNKDRDLFVIKT